MTHAPSPSSHLTAVRESYDTVAADYARLVKEPAELDPWSRAMLSAYAEALRVAGLGPVADLGCGPGKVTAHLAALGVPVSGVDLSPKMIELARRAHPDLDFTVGSMTALSIRDNELGGILAYYSTHHTPPEQLPAVSAEFHRTLAPGGLLMLAGHVGGDEYLRLRPTQAYGGHPVHGCPAAGPSPRGGRTPPGRTPSTRAGSRRRTRRSAAPGPGPQPGGRSPVPR